MSRKYKRASGSGMQAPALWHTRPAESQHCLGAPPQDVGPTTATMATDVDALVRHELTGFVISFCKP